MLHPAIAQAVAAEQRKDMLAHAAAVNRARAGRRAARGTSRVPASRLLPGLRPASAPRMA